MLLVAGAGLPACNRPAADGFPASVDQACPPGFQVAADRRCYRHPMGRPAQDATTDPDRTPPASPPADASPREAAAAPPDAFVARPGAAAPEAGGSPVAPDAGAAEAGSGLCAEVTCTFANATSTCDPLTGTCGRPTCLAGFGDCDFQPGCETRLDSAPTCGACDRACARGFTCSPGFSCTCSKTNCGSACVDLDTDVENCGRCGHPCPAGCERGSCRCPSPNPDNLLVNGGFDRDLSGWRFYQGDPSEQVWTADDAVGCLRSGSLVVRPLGNSAQGTTPYQCVRVTAGEMYNFGIRVEDPTRGTPQMSVAWWPTADCSGSVLSSMGNIHVQGSDPWQLVSISLRAPAGTRAATLEIGTYMPGTYALQVDMAYVTRGSGGF